MATIKLRKFEDINVVPFIDIMLVLLTIILITATFIAQGLIPVNLPKADAKPGANVKYVEISIQKSGDIYFGREKVDKALLKQRVDDLAPNDSIVVKSDKDAVFQGFVDVIDALKQKGLDKVTIVTAQSI
jgi:biopolymer transport protein ExbD